MAAKKHTKQPVNWRNIVLVGIGATGLIWMSTTRLAPLAIGLVVAAIVYQAVHGAAVGTFLNWLTGKG